MADPIKSTSKPLVSGYIGTQVGSVSNVSRESISTAQLRAGVKVEQKGWFAKVDGGYGSSYDISGETGKIFNLSRNVNFTGSIGARYLKDCESTDYVKEAFADIDQGPTWKPNHTEFFAKTKFERETSWGGFYGGLKASVEKSKCASLDGVTLPTDDVVIKGTEYAGTNTQTKLRPIFGINIDFGKNDNWRVAFDASSNEGSLRFSYKF